MITMSLDMYKIQKRILKVVITKKLKIIIIVDKVLGHLKNIYYKKQIFLYQVIINKNTNLF